MNIAISSLQPNMIVVTVEERSEYYLESNEEIVNHPKKS